MIQISALFIYPIKSLGGIPLTSALVTDRGLQHDRRWMLVDEKGQFMTQRQTPAMALLQVSLVPNGLLVRHRQTGESLHVPFSPESKQLVQVQVWDDACRAITVSDEADEWFSRHLEQACRLVFMPDDTRRPVDPDYAREQEITSFSDAYPFLIIGQSSLDDLNSRLQDPVPMDRFRPNIVFTGGQPFEEDEFHHFRINAVDFYGVKPCARCSVTTINQLTAEQGKEPLKTLATYRSKNNKVLFGQNLVHRGSGIISTGQLIQVVRRSGE